VAERIPLNTRRSAKALLAFLPEAQAES